MRAGKSLAYGSENQETNRTRQCNYEGKNRKYAVDPPVIFSGIGRVGIHREKNFMIAKSLQSSIVDVHEVTWTAYFKILILTGTVSAPVTRTSGMAAGFIDSGGGVVAVMGGFIGMR